MSRSPQPSTPLDRAETRRRSTPGLPLRWWLRQVATIGLVHAIVLLATYFLFTLGNALFTSYALVLKDSVFVNYLTQASWVRAIWTGVAGGTALVVGVSALAQTLLLSWRALGE